MGVEGSTSNRDDAPRKSFLRRLLSRLIALTVSVLIALLLAEGMIRLVSPRDLSGSWRVHSPTRGYLLNREHARARHALGDRVVDYRFNSLHLRGPEIDGDRPRVLCLGDSVTFGWRLEQRDTYLQILERRAREAFPSHAPRFLNAGTGGWGTASQLAFLEEFGERIDPDVVIIFVSTQDIGRSINTGLYKLKGPGSQEIEARSAVPDEFKEKLARSRSYQWLLEHSHLVQVVREAYLNVRTGGRSGREREPAGDAPSGPKEVAAATPSLDDRAVRLGKALFRRMHAWCRERDVPLWVCTTGFEKEHGPTEPLDRPTTRFVRVAGPFFEEEGIPYRNLYPQVFGRVDVQEYQIPRDLHPDEKGALLIADAAWPWLRERLAELLRRGE